MRTLPWSNTSVASIPDRFSVASTVNADRVLAVTALGGAAYLLCNLVAFGYGRDQGIYAVVADGVLRGAAPYRDVWDFKPPGIYFIFAFARILFGPEPHAVRILEALTLTSLVYAFAILSSRYVGSVLAGIVAGALAISAHVQLEFWNTAQPSSFAAPFVAWALVCVTYDPGEPAAHRARASGRLLLGGALYGCAALLKPPLGGGILVSAAFLAWQARRAAPSGGAARRIVRDSGLLMAGALVPVALVLGYFWRLGALHDLYDALLVFAPRYTALGLRNTTFGQLLLHTVVQWLGEFSVVNAVGLVLLLGLPTIAPREREGSLHVLAVVFVILCGVAVQAKFFAYHYSAALSLGALPAGWGFWKLWVRWREYPYGTLFAGTLLAVSIIVSAGAQNPPGTNDTFWSRCDLRVTSWLKPALRQQTDDRLYSSREVNPETNRRVATWLRQHTERDAAVFVWGFEPVIYELAQRQPASRYIYNVPQRVDWSNDAARAQLIADLSARPPAAIVVEHGDRMEWVTGRREDSFEALAGFQPLRRLLETEYRSAGNVANFDLYVRAAPNPDARDS